MKIGEIAQAVGLSPRTIRYYERCGLLKVDRAASSYRVFEEEDLVRLKLVKRLRRLGFSISEAKQVLPILVNQFPHSQKAKELRTFLQRRLQVAEEELSELIAIHQELQAKLKLLSHQTSAKATCCDPFCGPETCGPGLVQITRLSPKMSEGDGR